MKKEQLQQFLEIVEAGSINKASEKLYITQPSLSRSIKSLEEEIGKQLLERTAHGIKLTSTGKIFYNYAHGIVSQFNMLEKLKDYDNDLVYTQLLVSVDSIFLKDDLIYRFYQSIKSFETEIHLNETTAEEVINNVANGTSEIGIAVINDYQYKVYKKMAEIKDIDLEVLGDGPLYIHVHENSTLAKHNEVSAQELLNHIYIHLPYDFMSNLNRTLSVEGVRLNDLNKTITMSNYHAMYKMLQNTDSFILGHKWQIEELKSAHVKTISIKNNTIIKKFVILKRHKEQMSPAAEIFLNLIKETYGNI